MRKELKIQTIFPRIMWYDETIKNMAFQRDKVLGSCMTEDEEEAKMLNAILDELKLNALVITDPYNMRHVSGFRGGEGALYISAAQKVLITDSRYTEQAGKESDFTVIEECRGHNRQTILKECMEKENVSGDFHMGYEDQSMLCCDFDKLRKELPVQTWTPLGSRIDDLRQIKTEEELEYLARAEEIGDKAFAEFLKIVKPGMTELEAAAELEYLMKKEGTVFPFPLFVFSRERHEVFPFAENKKNLTSEEVRFWWRLLDSNQ